jgi:hypothetical protein
VLVEDPSRGPAGALEEIAAGLRDI